MLHMRVFFVWRCWGSKRIRQKHLEIETGYAPLCTLCIFGTFGAGGWLSVKGGRLVGCAKTARAMTHCAALGIGFNVYASSPPLCLSPLGFFAALAGDAAGQRTVFENLFAQLGGDLRVLLQERAGLFLALAQVGFAVFEPAPLRISTLLLTSPDRGCRLRS